MVNFEPSPRGAPQTPVLGWKDEEHCWKEALWGLKVPGDGRPPRVLFEMPEFGLGRRLEKRRGTSDGLAPTETEKRAEGASFLL